MKAVFRTTRFRLRLDLDPLIPVGAADAARLLRRGEWMHRTLCRPRNLLLGGLLIALLVSGRPENLNAQITGGLFPPDKAVVVSTGGTVTAQMSTGQAISVVKNTNDQVLSAKIVQGDPKRVFLTGLKPGFSHVSLTGQDNKTESYNVVVADVKVDDIKIAPPLHHLPPAPLDVSELSSQLRRAFPTANVVPVPIADNTILLEGTVGRIEDVDAVVAMARAYAPTKQVSAGVKNEVQNTVISHLRVAGVQQVQLCVTVAQVRRSDLRRMVFNFLTNSKNTFFGSTVGQAVTEPASVGVGGGAVTGSILSPAFLGQTISGVPGTPNGTPTNLLFGVIHNNFGFLAFLQALRDEGVVTSLAEPTLTTMSGRPAKFLVGGTQEIPVPAGLGQIGIEGRPFGTSLDFLPIVLGNGKIHLEVQPVVSSLDAANGTSILGTTVPGLDVTSVNTTVELEDGQTFVIGGLIQRDINGTTEKTPVLGDLPFLGAAFSSKMYEEIETEVVVMVTVHLVDPRTVRRRQK